MNNEHPLIGEFNPYDFEENPRLSWSDAKELWRIGVGFQFNKNECVRERMLNVVVKDIVSSS